MVYNETPTKGIIMSKFNRIKNFIYLHRAKFAAGTVTIAAICLFVWRVKEWDEFLKEHDLYDTYYMTHAFDQYQ